MTRLTFVFGDDWAALYRDGASVFQGHSINASVYHDLLEEAGFVLKYVDLPSQEPLVDSWSMISGCFPDTWPPSPEDEQKMQELIEESNRPVEEGGWG